MRCDLNILEIAKYVVDTLDVKKGEDILLLDVQNIASFTDYFVICTGTSGRMLDALAKSVQEEVKSKFGISSTIEGQPDNGWIILDLVDVVIHLFAPEQRNYYRLEELWNKGKVLVKLQ
ncbi:MAG: ribosome silencing factor [Chloroflexi bacterium HGW-Chloroflexi-8]|jgi:ribosome-associated protein|nr:MAG: ribosome silencing factor [Chloroflexi bacterium HGW-Chloroflexi-8]